MHMGMGWHRGPGGPGMGIVGTVASVSGTTITLTSKIPPRMQGGNSTTGNPTPTPTTFTVDASNATVIKDGATSTVSAIATGDTLVVKGTVSGTNIAATVIRDGVVPQLGAGNGPKGGWDGSQASSTPLIQGNGQPVVAGKVSAINGASLTITNNSNVTYTIDASSAKVQKGNMLSALSSIALGDSVVVQGAVNGTSITAYSVIDQGTPNSSESSGGPGNSMMGGFGGIMRGIGGFFQHLFGF